MLGLGSSIGLIGKLNKSLARRSRRRRRTNPYSRKSRKLSIKPRSGSLLAIPGIGLPVGLGMPRRPAPNPEQKANILAQIGGTQLRIRGQTSNNSVSRGY